MADILALHPSLAHGGIFAGLNLPGLIAPDMIGHGRARDWDGRGDLHTECTRDALTLAQGLQGPIHLIGHSFGATVALRMALERPELLQSLVLIEPVLFCAARADEAPEYRDFVVSHRHFEVMLAKGDLIGAAQHFQMIWGDGRDFARAPKALRDYILQRIPLIIAQAPALHQDSAGIMGYLRLESLSVPVLLLSGSASPPIIAAIHRALAARLPNVQQAVIAGARHMLPVTHPIQTRQAIIGFHTAL